MRTYLLLCRSITHAQRINAVLERAGVQGRIFRPSVGLTEKGCSYAVGIGSMYFETAIQQLRLAQILPERVYFSVGDGTYREILSW